MEQQKESILKSIDWWLILIVILLVITGLLMVFSATIKLPGSNIYLTKQLSGLFLGILLMIFFMGFNYQLFKQYYYFFYIMSIIFLIAVLIFGKQVHGTRAWIDFGFFSFQPSEVTKLLFIISLAGYLDKEWRDLYKWQKLFIPMMMLLGNTGLIILEPDFSGLIIYFPVFLAMLYCAKVRILHLSAILLYGIVTVTIPLTKTVFISKFPYSPVTEFFKSSWQIWIAVLIIGLLILFTWWLINKMLIYVPLFYFIVVYLIIIAGTGSSYVVDKSMKMYQKKRLIAFIDPKIDPLGIGYNIIQSKIAVGSGKIFGKGVFNGTQGQLGFIPARHTDFIFSLLAEELGFVYSSFVLILYFLLFWRAVHIAKISRSRYASLVSCGIMAMFAFYTIINIGMVLGMMPVTGLPLLFMSYGGSALVSSLMAIGILLSIYLRRFVY